MVSGFGHAGDLTQRLPAEPFADLWQRHPAIVFGTRESWLSRNFRASQGEGPEGISALPGT